jgi:hypothetical protein
MPRFSPTVEPGREMRWRVAVPVPLTLNQPGRGVLEGPYMNGAADGVVEALFCVLLAGDRYEAQRGWAEFREGKLVGLQVGRAQVQQDGGGLTAGFTLLKAFTAEPPGPGEFGRGSAVTRVYSRGALVNETDLGEVAVSADRL